jgi:hypothetical protein
MKRKALTIVLITVIAMSGAMVGYYWANRPTSYIPLKKPPPMISSVLSPFDSTIAQGATFQVNVTLTSFLDIEISIPIDLSLMAYNNIHPSPLPQEKIFNYTISPNPVIIAPNGTNSSILTVKLAEDAPIGDYMMYVTFGNWQLTNVSGETFMIRVASP